MKKIRFLMTGTIFILAALLMTACGKSEFGVTENTGKQMKIVAENADKEAFFMVGISITGELEKGSVTVEIVAAPAEEHKEDEPDLNAEAILTANLDSSSEGTDTISGTMDAGSYMVRATCEEKATGTIMVEVKPAQ